MKWAVADGLPPSVKANIIQCGKASESRRHPSEDMFMKYNECEHEVKKSVEYKINLCPVN